MAAGASASEKVVSTAGRRLPQAAMSARTARSPAFSEEMNVVSRLPDERRQLPSPAAGGRYRRWEAVHHPHPHDDERAPQHQRPPQLSAAGGGRRCRGPGRSAFRPRTGRWSCSRRPRRLPERADQVGLGAAGDPGHVGAGPHGRSARRGCRPRRRPPGAITRCPGCTRPTSWSTCRAVLAGDRHRRRADEVHAGRGTGWAQLLAPAPTAYSAQLPVPIPNTRCPVRKLGSPLRRRRRRRRPRRGRRPAGADGAGRHRGAGARTGARRLGATHRDRPRPPGPG